MRLQHPSAHDRSFALLRTTLFGLALLASVPAWSQDACPPEGIDAGSLSRLKEQKFAIEDAATRNTFASGLLGCLSDPETALPIIAYEALAQWMRGDQLDVATRRQLSDRLQAMFKEPDADGFRRPFAALVLSEVARTDRITPWMSPKERAVMVDAAAEYLESVRDYRGYDDSQGWRHGVAHGSDWLMQLALNPALERGQLDPMLAAIARGGAGIGACLCVRRTRTAARPVLYLAKRGWLSEAEWIAWFGELPARIGDPAKAYSDSAWLARRHDLLAFLSATYLEADQSDDVQIKAFKGAGDGDEGGALSLWSQAVSRSRYFRESHCAVALVGATQVAKSAVPRLHRDLRRSHCPFSQQLRWNRRHRRALVQRFALHPLDECFGGRSEWAMRGIYRVVGEARFQCRAGQADQFVALQVGHDDLLARQRRADAVDRRAHGVGAVAEGVHSRQVESAYAGRAEPVAPALQGHVADQWQRGDLLGFGQFAGAGQRGRRHREQFVVHQVMRSQSCPLPGSMADAQVRAVVVETGQGDIGFNIDADVRMLRAEAGSRGNNQQ